MIAHRGIETARSRWAATGDHLSTRLGVAVEMIPLELARMEQVVREGRVDFVIVNPGAYVELSNAYGISALATLEKTVGGNPISHFGGVVFAKAERADLSFLSDLDGQHLLAVAKKSFGGFQVGWRELRDAGLDIDGSFASFEFTGFPQDGARGQESNGSAQGCRRALSSSVSIRREYTAVSGMGVCQIRSGARTAGQAGAAGAD